nr:MAG TPA: hypothetical protein [Caudoviricetes sp.]
MDRSRRMTGAHPFTPRGLVARLPPPAQIAPLLDLPPEGYFEMGFSLHGLVLTYAGLFMLLSPVVV